jgi:tryptophan synthase alpha chain
VTPAATLTQLLTAHRASGRKAFVPYVMDGFPDRRRFRALAELVLAQEPQALEIGVPFSDPLADGPVIQAAGERALAGGANLDATLEDAARLARSFPRTPLLLMSYVNPLLARGVDRVARQSRAAGITGWIVPDRDLLDRRDVVGAALARGLAAPPMVTPTTPAARLPALLRDASGFVYVVSATGVTGARDGRLAEVEPMVRMLRPRTPLPLYVGFGVSTAEQAATLARSADGVVVGSALLEPFLALSFSRARAELSRRLRGLRRALDSVSGIP